MRNTGSKAEVLVKAVPVKSGGVEEIHVSASAGGSRGSVAARTRALYEGVLARLEDAASLRIVAERVFGGLAAKAGFVAARAEVLAKAGVDAEGPVTYLECAPAEGGSPAAAQLTLVRQAKGVAIAPLFDPSTDSGPGGARPCGFRVAKGRVVRAWLSGMQGVGRGRPASGETQAARMFERAAAVLKSAGLSYRSVVCTRIYIRRLLDWYNEFNAVRNLYYREIGLIGGAGITVPASTGIQGKTSQACECVMDVFALSKGDADRMPFVKLRNPLQSEATDYGSSFARGARLDLSGARHVFISGTASIDECGRSVHPGDARAQARRTMENFEAIARAGGARLSDLYQAVWYCKRPSYAMAVRGEMRRRGWPDFPYAFVTADVCRPELLVEIDGAAVIRER